MSPHLNELCNLMYKCAEKIEEEFKTNINKYQNDIISNEITETELAFDKNKDFHYREIIKILGEIMMNVKKIIYHDDFIRKLKKHEKYEPTNDDENFPFLTLTRTGAVGVIRREKRRIASEVSLQSLDAWESYLRMKEEENQILQAEGNEAVAKKIHHRYKRRNKKMVSSTFNNILEDNSNSNCEPPNCNSLIIEENEQTEEEGDSLGEKKCYSAEYPGPGSSISSSMFDLLLGLPQTRAEDTKSYTESEEEEEIDKGEEEIDKGEEEIDKGEEEIDKGEEELDKEEEIDKGEEEIDEVEGKEGETDNEEELFEATPQDKPKIVDFVYKKPN